MGFMIRDSELRVTGHRIYDLGFRVLGLDLRKKRRRLPLCQTVPLWDSRFRGSRFRGYSIDVWVRIEGS